MFNNKTNNTMDVVISKQHLDFFNQFDATFQDRTLTTLTMNVNKKQFTSIYNRVILLGYNPYELMAW